MGYHYSRKSNLAFLDTVEKVKENLQNEGFGILTQIDIKDTFKKKLDIDFRNYKILGACNPNFAYKALGIEPNLGVMLPCNVAVREQDNGDVIVSAINPMETMALSIKNSSLETVAAEVSSKLMKAIDAC